MLHAWSLRSCDALSPRPLLPLRINACCCIESTKELRQMSEKMNQATMRQGQRSREARQRMSNVISYAHLIRFIIDISGNNLHLHPQGSR
jgi:hypothetical protein